MGRVVSTRTMGNPYTHSECVRLTIAPAQGQTCAWCGRTRRFLYAYAVRDGLHFGIDFLDQLLAVDRLLEQRFEDGQQALRFLERECLLTHELPLF